MPPAETTILTPEATTTKPAAGAAPAAGSDPKATPDGKAPAPAPTPAPAKPDGSSPDPTKAPEPAAKPVEGQDPKPAAPEPWKITDLKVPEGMTIDPAIGEKLTAVGQELKLSKEGAQKLVDLQSEVATKAMNDAVAQWDSMKETWKQESVKELGTDADKQLAYAATFIARYGDDELKQLLTDTGTGNHKALVRCLVKAGKAMSEDTFTEGKTRANATDGKTPAEILYPTTK